MTDFSTCIMSWARDTAENSLTDTCTVQQVTEVNAGTGPTQSWATKASAVPCFITTALLREVEAVLGEQPQSQIIYKVLFPYDQDIDSVDRILTSDSRTLHVIAAPKYTGQTYQVAICKQVGA